ncbi:hypothetical protein BC826DRAFT_155937 [Russula brevipes]|nr:hypothetical protein BC826DRAFT_155937 [Russula brevipes]
MSFIDTISFCLSLLGIYSLIFSLRILLPRYFIPSLSVILNETQQLLHRAETINAIPPGSEYRSHLDRLANQFMAMRMESNRSWGTFQQLRVAIRRGLTCRLYTLYYRIESTKLRLELAVDVQQVTITESAASQVLPSPPGNTAIPANDSIEPTLPLPATTS